MVMFDNGQSLAASDIRKQRKDDTVEYYSVDLMPLSDSMQKRAVYSMSQPLGSTACALFVVLFLQASAQIPPPLIHCSALQGWGQAATDIPVRIL